MEVPDQVGEDKFKVNDDYDFDKSRIAQWLRAIDTLNREADFSEFAGDPVFRVLQNEVKMCNFSRCGPEKGERSCEELPSRRRFC